MEDRIEKLKFVAIHCKTKKEAVECCTLADKLGLRWLARERFTELNYWKTYESETAYNFLGGTYSNVEWCKTSGFKIHSAKWFLKNFGNK